MQISGPYFKDQRQRTLLLRGINLGGTNKVPSKPSPFLHENYDNLRRKVSFVNRPFPLANADEHFLRLKTWGFSFIRFLVPWEAIEHQAPGVYDEEYLDYLYQLLKKAGEYDLKILIVPHQDVWSRFSGGAGAPLWTIEKIGFNVRQFNESGAAILYDTYKPYPPNIWATNYSKLVTATMFSLFFGGNDFAPNLKIDGLPAQEFLQTYYLSAIKALAEKLRDLDHVIGYCPMNNPSPGWIGWKDLQTNDFPIRLGASPSPFQSMALGSGAPLRVENWEVGLRGAKRKGYVEANTRGVKTWLNGFRCIWKMHGVWDLDQHNEPILLKPAYFSKVDDREVDFNNDYLKPFIQRFSQQIHSISPQAIIFVEYPSHQSPPRLNNSEEERIVNTVPWTDNATLSTQKFRSWLSYDAEQRKTVWGKKGVRKLFINQFHNVKKGSAEYMNNAPSFIGELGIPFNMQNGKSFQDLSFVQQHKALDAYFKAIEENLLNVAIWHYSADNTHEFGDLWNLEDYSIFCKDQREDKQDINSGGRALKAVVRPYPICTSGIPLLLNFDMRKLLFEYEFQHDEELKNVPTEIFVPKLQYPQGYKVVVSDGDYTIDEENQRLIYHHTVDRFRHSIRIMKN